MSIIIEKRNVSPFSNVDQRDFDKAVRDARLKQWRNGGRKLERRTATGRRNKQLPQTI